MIRGYARVSTADQDLAGQIDMMTAAAGRMADCGNIKIYREKVSGAKSDRFELKSLLRDLEPADVVMVTRLDRLARSTLDLLGILKTVSDRGAAFISLHETWANTLTAHGRLIVTIMGGIAEFERELIMARTSEGRERARAAGKRLGGPKPENHKMTAEQRGNARLAMVAGAKAADLADKYGVSIRTIARLKT